MKTKHLLTVILCAAASAVSFAAEGLRIQVEPLPANAGVREQMSRAYDAGDGYPTPSGFRKLHRMAGAVVIELADGATREATERQLTAPGGALPGYAADPTRLATGPRMILQAPAAEREAQQLRAAKDDGPLTRAGRAAGVRRSDPLFIDPASGLFLVPTDELIVFLKPGEDPQKHFGPGWTSLPRIPGAPEQFIVRLPGASAEAVLAETARRAGEPGVAWAEPSFVLQLVRHFVPNDTFFAKQWHLNNTNQTGAGVTNVDINATQAWDITSGRPQITVAVLDEGIQISHPDLAGQLASNTAEIPGNGIDDDGNGYVDDVNGWSFVTGQWGPDVTPRTADENHGTSVAGLAVADGNNGGGVAGVAYGCGLLPVRVTDAAGSVTAANLAAAIYYAGGFNSNGVAAWRGADVLNLSFTVPQNAPGDAALTKVTTEGRKGRGCLVFASSGNGDMQWSRATFTGAPAGNHTLTLAFAKNGILGGGEDAVWLGEVRVPGGGTYALGTLSGTALPAGWSYSGPAPWTNLPAPDPVTLGAALGALRSPSLGNSQTGALNHVWNNTVGPSATGYFDCRVSTLLGDGLLFSVDGIPQTLISGIASSPAFSWPASHSNVIAVGAITDQARRAVYSQFGPKLELAAPSGGGLAGVWTTDRTGTNGYNTNLTINANQHPDYYSNFSGTSASSPISAGVGALVLSANTNLTLDEVRFILRATASKVGPMPYTDGRNDYFGYGLVNAFEALKLATNFYRLPPDTRTGYIVDTFNLTNTPASIGTNLGGTRLFVTNGGVLRMGPAIIGQAVVASTNSATVTGPGSGWFMSGDLTVGHAGAQNLLQIQGGGTVSNAGCIVGNGNTSHTNRVIVDGANSVWTNSFALLVGLGGRGNSVLVTNGGRLVTPNAGIGNFLGSDASSLIVTGPGSRWTAADVTVGDQSSSNRLVVSSNASVQALSIMLGGQSASQGNEFVLDGGAVTNTSFTEARRGQLTLNSGVLSAGFLRLTNSAGRVDFSGGTLVTYGAAISNAQPFVVGDTATAPAVWEIQNGAGTTSIQSNLIVGGSAPGRVNIAPGEVVNVYGLADFQGISAYIGTGPASAGSSVTVNGGSLWNAGQLVVGANGPYASLVISNGARVENSDGWVGAEVLGRSNVVTVTGFGSVWTNRGNLRLGYGRNYNRLVIENFGRVDNGFAFVGSEALSIGNEVLVQNNAEWHNAGQVSVGEQGLGSIVKVYGSGLMSAPGGVVVGAYSSSTDNRLIVDFGGTLLVTNSAGNGTLDVRRGTNAFGAGLIDADRLLVTLPTGAFEFNGGTLLTRGGSISNGQPFIVGRAGSPVSARWVVTRSPFSLDGDLTVGGTGLPNNLDVTNNGALLVSGDVIVGAGGGPAQALVNGSGSSLNVAGGVTVGFLSSQSSLALSNGASASASWVLVGDSNLAGQDNNLIVNNSTLIVTNASGTGVLEVRRGTNFLLGGSIEADTLLMTNNLGRFALRAGTLTAARASVLNGQVFFVGNSASNATYFMDGATNLHTFGNGITISNNAALRGNGTIAGAVTVRPGGTLAPGASIGVITLSNALTLQGTLVMEISTNATGTTNDQLRLATTLTYGGSLVVTNLGPTPAVGSRYVLFDAPAYAGVFTNIVLPPVLPGRFWTNTLAVDGSISVLSTPTAFTNLAWWRFGENDAAAADGVPTNQTANLLGGTLKLLNSPVFTASVAASAASSVGSRLGLNFPAGRYGTNALVTTATNNVGLELWVKPNATNGTQAIAYSGNSSFNGFGLYLVNGRYRGLFGSVSFVGSAPATPGVWTHLALVVDGGVTTLYADGLPAGSLAAAPKPAVGRFAVGINASDLVGEPFTGALDEVRFFSFSPGGFSPSGLLFYSDEQQPAVVTLDATGVTSSGAVLNGTANPENLASAAWFEWGTTTAYGNSTALVPLSATNATFALSQPLAGLVAGTTYHFRAAASNALGVSYGSDMAFTPPAFISAGIAVPGLMQGSVAWGDFDNDGRLDLLATGLASTGRVAQLWRNLGTGFTNVTATWAPGLPPVNNSSSAWVDYDNDGRLDFLLTGNTNGPLALPAQLWRNTGSGFTNVTATVAPGLPGAMSGAVAWGDFDNDGRPDLLITGNNGTTNVGQLWQNKPGGFTNVTASLAPGLPTVQESAVAWADYDNDGRLDFIIAGTRVGGPITQLWRNTGSGFTNVTAVAFPTNGLPGYDYGAVAWCDFDNDGWLDFLITGNLAGSGFRSQLWRNTGGAFTNVTASAAPGLLGVFAGAVAWGDYDNDGAADFLITGKTNSLDSQTMSQLWRNTGTGFSNISAGALPGLPATVYSSIAWADYDNDGRLDFFLCGKTNLLFDSTSQLWRNQSLLTNTLPSAPTGLALTASSNAVMLSWNAASDAQTPASGLSYNVRAGTTPGGTNLLAALVNPGTGFRRVPALGNAQLRLSLPLLGVTNGQTVYWSVQAVDGAFAGGPFATETSVVTIPQLTITPGNSSTTVGWWPATWGWLLEQSPTLAPAAWTDAPSGELNPVSITTSNAASFYRLRRP